MGNRPGRIVYGRENVCDEMLAQLPRRRLWLDRMQNDFR
jgi:hypothetical protein